MKMVCLLFLLSLLLCSSVNCQELIPLHESTMAVRVETQHLKNVSHSVVMAESWLRTHVLSHYPSTIITAVLVGHPVFCSKDHNQDLVLPSVKNLHHSLTRWGLHNHIKVTASFNPACSENDLNPLISSPYPFFDDSRRKLMLIDSAVPFPPRPISVAAPSNSPSRPTSPAYGVGSPPLPPLVGTVAAPPDSLPPVAAPAHGPRLPPCEPWHGGAPVGGRVRHGVWCVAKPSVPAETLQEALDYACGEGNADCGEIREEGSCYFPDNVVAHASYAFNSYWQKTKSNGGTCGFGGTAMLINSDPSYAHCRFILT